MKYDFTTILDRRGRDANAVDRIPVDGATVDEGFDRIPMWVADMNFPVVPAIQEAIAGRLAHPAFGYFRPRAEYFDSIINWHRERNGVEELTPAAIGYENGVLGGVASALSAFTLPGEAVLVHSPTYIGFTHVLEDNGRTIVLSDLKRDENGVWRMDYEDMDAKLKKYRIHLAIFCSPHNPSGRVWEREEIEKAMEVYEKNDCLVISDEIWSDLTLAGYRHIPTQSVSKDARQRTIAFYAPSKTFNLAGLVGAYHITYNRCIRERMDKAAAMTHYNSMNVLSQYALIGAYSQEGQTWVDELRQVLTENVDYAYRFLTEQISGVSLAKPQGTYMLYLDCTQWCREHQKTLDELLKAGIRVGVIWQDGRPFNRPNTIRMNVALPKSRVEEAMSRLKTYVF